MVKYCLVDISGIIYRAFYALDKDKFHRSDGFPTNAILGTINILKHLNKTLPDHTFIACCDSKRSELVRTQNDSSYKTNRSDVDPVLIQQFEPIFHAIDCMKITKLKIEGYEADDIIASFCEKFKDTPDKITIASSDKDMYQLLVHDNVQIYNPTKKTFIYAADCETKFHVKPNQFTFYQALVGDKVDNIQGVKGVGPKTAVKIVNEFHTAVAFIECASHKYAKTEHMSDFQLSLRHVTLQTNLEIKTEYFSKQNFKTKEFREFCKTMEIRS
jgi:DNA polymerase-1